MTLIAWCTSELLAAFFTSLWIEKSAGEHSVVYMHTAPAAGKLSRAQKLVSSCDLYHPLIDTIIKILWVAFSDATIYGSKDSGLKDNLPWLVLATLCC